MRASDHKNMISLSALLVALPLATAMAQYEPAPVPPSVPSQSPTPIQCPRPSQSPSPQPSPVPVADVTVSMSNNRYDPSQITIRVGQTVTWRNDETAPHTVTDDPCEAANPANAVLPQGAEPFDSGTLGAGDTFTKTFTVPGEYKYFCEFHEGGGMVGTITVTP